MSALGSKADMCSAQADVRLVPIADICRRHQAVTTFARFIVAVRTLDLSPTADIQIAFHTGIAPAHSGAAR